MKPFELSSSTAASTRTTPLRHDSVGTLTPWIVGGLAFLFRFASPRDLTNDHYMHLSWSQQILMGELPGRDFVDPGMPLAWGSSAIVQAIYPGPFSEILFSALMFGVTAGLLYWVTARLTGSRGAGMLAALISVLFVPRLYNYPKLLVPALTMFLLQRYVEHRSARDRAALGIGVAAAVLFRHDLGLYAAVVVVATLAITHRDSYRDAVRALFRTGAVALIALLPYLVYVQWSEGLIEHVRRGIEFSKGESHGLQYAWPAFPALTNPNVTWSQEDATSYLYYLAWLLPFASLIRFKGASRIGTMDRLPLALAATLFLGLYLPIILRHPIVQRLPDVAAPFAVAALFVAHGAMRASFRASVNPGWVPPARIVAYVGGIAVIVVTVITLLNSAIMGRFARELEDTRIDRGPLGVIAKVRSLAEDSTVWPWAKVWPNSGGFPAAVLYVRACTNPSDYLLMTWPSSEYYFFAQRKFAAGHTMFLPPDAFTTNVDQDFMLARLNLEKPPIALVNQTRAEAFRRAYPRVDAWIAENYTPSATYRHYDNDEIAIAIRNDLEATSTFGDSDWPCGLAPRPAPSASESDAAR